MTANLYNGAEWDTLERRKKGNWGKFICLGHLFADRACRHKELFCFLFLINFSPFTSISCYFIFILINSNLLTFHADTNEKSFCEKGKHLKILNKLEKSSKFPKSFGTVTTGCKSSIFTFILRHEKGLLRKDIWYIIISLRLQINKPKDWQRQQLDELRLPFTYILCNKLSQ